MRPYTRVGGAGQCLRGRARGSKKESPASPTEALTWMDMSDLPGKSEKPSTSNCSSRAAKEELGKDPRAAVFCAAICSQAPGGLGASVALWG